MNQQQPPDLGAPAGPAAPQLATFFEALRETFTAARMDAFAEAPDDPDWLCLSRYCYSLAMAEALYPSLHVLEVTLRNVTYRAVSRAYPTAATEGIALDSWLDRKVPILHEQAVGLVNEAKEAIVRDGRPLDGDALVAELKFGFWTMLFSKNYGARSNDDPRFWPRLLPDVFPRMPDAKRTRRNVAELLHKARDLRNRVFHHEPIWQRKLYRDYRDITQLIEWMSPAAATLTAAASRFPELEAKGKAQFNNTARHLLAEWRTKWA